MKPKDVYPMPMTSSQMYGWDSETLVSGFQILLLNIINFRHFKQNLAEKQGQAIQLPKSML